ncbi:MAG: hypothetical protein HKN20_00585 [Gemmatimonadetes bacterium]|nr:hypothetical protein [Gemmatimonadota bacterium]
MPGSRAGTEPHVLLEATGTGEKFPWLSCVETETSRVVLIGGVFGAGDAASLFRNGQDRFPDPPNRVYDVLVSALQWALYGDDTGPIPALQFCAADAAVMIRLDGDHSDRPGDFEQTFSYLFAIAEESGVGAAYGIVTGRADEAGWSRFAPLAKQLEELGGEIGTHTHTHDIYGVIDDDIVARELDESIRAIDHDLEAAGYDAEGVPFLINPNGMIPMTAHGEISSRFPLFLTHGISASVPVAYGVSTWFAESDPPFAVIYDSPEPDFQWLYAREWSYTAAEAGEIESAIFRHYTNEIGRGVLFDMMWHDYGIASSGYDQSRPRFRWADLFKPARKKSASNRPLFDMLRGEFAEASIYCPEPLEAAEKLRIMQGADYMWSREGSALVFTIDLTGSDEFALACAGGLGLRIDRAQLPIRSVTINGNDHPAFTDDVVILPALEAGMTRVTVRFGADNGRSRLLYLSKRPHRIRAVHDGSQDELNASFEAEGVARFTVRPAGPNPCVRGVDEFRVRMRDGERIVDGRNRGGGSMIVEASPPHFPQWDSAEGAVESLETAGDGFRIELDARHLPEVTLRFRTEETVTFARMHGGTEERIRSRAEGTLQVLTIPAPREHSRITGTIGGGS